MGRADTARRRKIKTPAGEDTAIRIRHILFVALLCLAALSQAPAKAAYPEHPVRLIVGAAPGGGTDFLARLIAQKLGERWGQQVTVENRPGADNVIAASFVANAAPDGLTVLIMNANHTITPALRAMPYDPVESFSPILRIGSFPDVLVVNPAVMPARSVADLVAAAKAQPGHLSYSSSGPGGSPYMAMELFSRRKGIQMVNVTYKGTGPAMVGLLGGEVGVMFASVAASGEHIKSGRLRALAVSSAARVSVLPDVPTMQEAAGFEDFDLANWYGFLAPAHTPPAIVAALHDSIAAVVALPAVDERIQQEGFLPATANTPEEFRAYLVRDLGKWAELMRIIDAK